MGGTGMNEGLIIYSPAGNIIAKVEKWEFHDAYMGEQYLSFDLKSEKPIAWSLGCYCMYRGVKYSINYIPSVTQKARLFETGEAFVYDNVKFESPREELTRIIMLDITATTGDYIASLGTNFTGSAQFELFCGKATVDGTTYTPVCALAAKIQANLDRVFKGNDAWHIIVDLENTDTAEKMLSFDNTTLQAALEMLYNEFKLSYSIVGRTISIGSSLKYLTANKDGAFFRYGYGKGNPSISESGIVRDSGTALYEIKRSSDSSQKIVTRLRALGSTKNLPYRFYNKKYLNEQGELISQTMHPTALQLPGTFLPLGTPDDAPGADTKWGRNKTHSELYANVLGDTNDSYIDKNDDAEHTEEGLREECARWDGSNADLEEIYPTIKEMTYGHLRAALTPDINGIKPTGESDTNAYKNYGNDERVDEILSFDELTNYGDGLLAENKVDTQGREHLNLTEEMQKATIIDNHGWDVVKGDRTSPTKWLFTIDDVGAGRWMLSPEEQHVFVGASLSLGQHNGGGVTGQMAIGYRLYVVSADDNVSLLRDKDGNKIDFYESNTVIITNNGTYTEMEVEALPDATRQDLAKIASIKMDRRGAVKIGISVFFTSYKRNGISVNIVDEECKDTTVAWRVGLSDSQRRDPDISKLTSFMWYRENTSSTYMNTNFTLFIKDFGVQEMVSCFNTSEDAVIAMTSGRCVGREFKIVSEVPQKVVINGKTCWKVECSRAQDSALQTYYPSEVDYISTEDNFVLLNVSMPDSYIQAAEIRLLEAATRYLADNCNTKYTYQPSIDDIYLVRDFDLHGEKSIYWNLYAGYKFPFFGIPDNVNQNPTDVIVELTIKNLTIKEGDGITPKVEITLNDEVEQSTIQKLTTAVDRLYSGSAVSSSGGISMSSVRSFIDNYGRGLFVSKTSDDTVNGNIKFEKSISSTNFSSGEFGTGWGISNKEDGSHVESDYLDVRRTAYFRMLTISEVKHIGGELILSAAACQISEVEETESQSKPVYRCYFDREVNGKVVFNEWEVGDLAYCATFAPKEGTGEAVKNHFFWRKVYDVHVGQENDADDRHYIDFVREEGGEGTQYAEGSDAPQANDNIVLLGSKESGYRQTAQVYSTVEANAPSRKYYAGIDSFSLEGKAVETLEWDSTTSSPHWNVGGDGGNSIDFKEGKLKIKVGGNDVEETLDDKFDTYIEDEYNALRDSSGNVIEVMSPDQATWLPSYGQTEDELARMVGSFLLTKDGVAYKFIVHSGRYVWQAVDDVYLLQALNEAKKNSRWVQEFEDGKYKNFVKNYNEEAGVMLTSQFAGLLARSEVNGIPLSAAMGVFVRDGASGAFVQADKIQLKGHTMNFEGDEITINTENFKLDEEGSVYTYGTLDSGNTALMNRTCIDGGKGHLNMYGPSSVEDTAPYRPTEDAKEICLFGLEYGTDKDINKRCANMYFFCNGSTTVGIDGGWSTASVYIYNGTERTHIQPGSIALYDEFNKTQTVIHAGDKFVKDGDNVTVGYSHINSDGIKIGDDKNYILINQFGVEKYENGILWSRAKFEEV